MRAERRSTAGLPGVRAGERAERPPKPVPRRVGADKPLASPIRAKAFYGEKADCSKLREVLPNAKYLKTPLKKGDPVFLPGTPDMEKGKTRDVVGIQILGGEWKGLTMPFDGNSAWILGSFHGGKSAGGLDHSCGRRNDMRPSHGARRASLCGGQ